MLRKYFLLVIIVNDSFLSFNLIHNVKAVKSSERQTCDLLSHFNSCDLTHKTSSMDLSQTK